MPQAPKPPQPPQEFQEREIASMDPSALIRILKDNAAPEFRKAKACVRLGELGSVDAVPALAALLDNEHLSVYARYGLEPIAGPAPDEALRNALTRLKGVRLAGVINSLAKRRDVKAVPAITKLAQSPDPEIARAAIAALGAISGEPAARELQAALARAAGPMRPAVADACLICAERLLAAGNRARALSLYTALTAPDVPKPARLAAMNAIIAAETAANRPR